MFLIIKLKLLLSELLFCSFFYLSKKNNNFNKRSNKKKVIKLRLDVLNEELKKKEGG